MTSTPTRPVDNVVITTKGLQDRNLHIIDGTKVENKAISILKAQHTLCACIVLASRVNCVLLLFVFSTHRSHPREELLANSARHL